MILFSVPGVVAYISPHVRSTFPSATLCWEVFDDHYWRTSHAFHVPLCQRTVSLTCNFLYKFCVISFLYGGQATLSAAAIAALVRKDGNSWILMAVVAILFVMSTIGTASKAGTSLLTLTILSGDGPPQDIESLFNMRVLVSTCI